MASEYLKKKYQDVKPEEKRELTPEEKRRNWWYYHKWHVGAVLLLLVVAGDIVWTTLNREKPDCQVAYIGTQYLPDGASAALESAFASLCEDFNGDGKIIVSFRQYVSGGEADAGMAAASQVQLMADITEGESYLFLLEDPEAFQRSYHSLCRLDGTLPEEEDYSAEGTYLAWDACPVLRGLDLGEYSYTAMGQTVEGSVQELLSGLFIARRGFWTDQNASYAGGYAALWNRLTEGAVS